MGLATRARDLLASPRSEWEKIAGETIPVSELFLGYAAPLAAIGPIAQFVGLSVFGLSVPFVGSFRISPATALLSAIVRYVLSLAGVWGLGLVIDAIAPAFGGRRDARAAFAVAVYASTAAWIAGVFALLPPLWFLAILGLYSLYLLYLGLSPMMKSPRDKALGYTIVVVVAAAVVWMVIVFATRPLMRGSVGGLRFGSR